MCAFKALRGKVGLNKTECGSVTQCAFEKLAEKKVRLSNTECS